jgi:two-component system response regulator RegA
MLQALDRYVVGAHNAELAIAAVNESHPELALVDMYMPKCNGIETIARLRAQCPTLILVLFSSLLEPCHIAAAMKAGADDCLDAATPPNDVLRLVESGQPIPIACDYEPLERITKHCVMRAIVRTKGNLSDAARILGISRRGLQKMLAKWGGKL